MTEDFLHYVWKYKAFNLSDLKTLDGEPIQVIKTGEHNQDAGPDFFNARLKIGTTTWAGNIELHLRSSDWKKHQHNNNGNYDNLILHLVYENDEAVSHTGKPVATAELKNLVDKDLLNKYNQLLNAKQWIPCANQLNTVSSFTLNNWSERLLIERLERKAKVISALLELNKNNLEETFYIQLARNFGMNVNALPFELLAKSLPNSFLGKHKSSLFQVEALLFGQSGLLEKQFKDDYPNQLKKEYEFLQKKFSLQPLEAHLWKFLRLRPVNFPTVRIAQLASLIHNSSGLFSKIMEAQNVDELQKLLSTGTSVYWNTHYVFDKESPARLKNIGDAAIDNIIINSVVPFMFVYAGYKGLEEYKDKAVALLEQMNYEKNNITLKFIESGLKLKNAATSQSLIELKNEYCSFKKCLNCGIGISLLKK
ncbi:MAG: hypothetical protein POELPBGB_03170 [Bacteroidia bacterium]|nr:hypothetical protein [Bacteroidia bacterium]